MRGSCYVSNTSRRLATSLKTSAGSVRKKVLVPCSSSIWLISINFGCHGQEKLYFADSSSPYFLFFFLRAIYTIFSKQSQTSLLKLFLKFWRFCTIKRTFLRLWQTLTRSTSTLIKSSTSNVLFLLFDKSPFTEKSKKKLWVHSTETNRQFTIHKQRIYWIKKTVPELSWENITVCLFLTVTFSCELWGISVTSPTSELVHTKVSSPTQLWRTSSLVGEGATYRCKGSRKFFLFVVVFFWSIEITETRVGKKLPGPDPWKKPVNVRFM